MKMYAKTKIDNEIDNYNTEQSVTDDPMAYVDNILKMLASTNLRANQETKVEKLYDGLPPKLKVHFITNTPTTVSRFVEKLKDEVRKSMFRQKAQEIERSQTTTKTVTVSSAQAYANFESQHPTDPIAELTKKIEELTHQLNNQQRESNPPQHFSQQQRYNPPQQFSSKPRMSRNAPDGRPNCFRCGKTGHVSKHCRSGQQQQGGQDRGQPRPTQFKTPGYYQENYPPDAWNPQKLALPVPPQRQEN